MESYMSPLSGDAAETSGAAQRKQQSTGERGRKSLITSGSEGSFVLVSPNVKVIMSENLDSVKSEENLDSVKSDETEETDSETEQMDSETEEEWDSDDEDEEDGELAYCSGLIYPF